MALLNRSLYNLLFVSHCNYVYNLQLVMFHNNAKCNANIIKQPFCLNVSHVLTNVSNFIKIIISSVIFTTTICLRQLKCLLKVKHSHQNSSDRQVM